jgi:hypothetical protein
LLKALTLNIQTSGHQVFELLPPPLQDSVKYFSSVFKLSKHNANFSILLHFVAKYKVPWILKWHYEVTADLVTQHFSINWWDKFIHDRIISQASSSSKQVKKKGSQPDPFYQDAQDPYEAYNLDSE